MPTKDRTLPIDSDAAEDAGAPESQPKAGWCKAELPELAPSTTAEAALTEIILGCVEHMRGNEACVLGRGHEEGVHQMRVAARRLRSCLALYGRFIPGDGGFCRSLTDSVDPSTWPVINRNPWRLSPV